MDLKSKAVNATKWTTLSQLSSAALQFIQISLIARVLTPSQFGLVALTTVIINFFNIFSDLGLSNSIIYKQETDRKILSSVYCINILLGLVIYILLFSTNKIFASYYSNNELSSLIRISSLLFLVIPPGQLYQFILQKDLRFKNIALIEIAGSLAGTAVTILLAYNGYKELSLIYGQIVMYGSKSLLFLVTGFKYFVPQLYVNIKSIEEHIRFGLFNLGENILNFCSSNSDYMIIGSTLGPKYLGYYTLAYQLVIFPMSKINPILVKVAFPLLSQMKDKLEIRQAYLKLLDIISFIIVPLLFGLFAVADEIIPVVYGKGWEVSVLIVKILAGVGILRSLSNPIGSLMMSQGKTEFGFYLNAITLALQLPVLYLGSVYYGIVGVACGFLVVQFINNMLAFYFIKRMIGSLLTEFLVNSYKQFLFGIGMILIIQFVKPYLPFDYLPKLIVEVILGGIVYLVSSIVWKWDIAQLKRMFG